MSEKPSVKLKKLWYSVTVIWLGLLFIAAIALAFSVTPLVGAITGAVLILLASGILAWIPAAYRETSYGIGQDGVRMKWGVVWKKQVIVPYQKITNVDITQGPLERLLGISTVHLQTAGAGGQQGQKAELKLPGIENSEHIRGMVLENLEKGVVSETQKQKSEYQLLTEILEQVKVITSMIGRKS